MNRLIKNRQFHLVFFESLGSLILTYGVCASSLHIAPDVIVAASLFLAISLTGEITGGYINPLISIGTYIDDRHNKLTTYLLAQFMGAFVGAFFSWGLLGGIAAPFHESWDSFDFVKFALNQLMGSAIFTVCVLTLTNKYTTHAVKSWQTYMSIPVALFLVRKMTGDTVLNPSVGFCLQMVAAIREGDVLILFRDVWPLLVPSIIGAIVGGYFMKGIYEPLLLYIKYKDLAEETDSALLREEQTGA